MCGNWSTLVALNRLRVRSERTNDGSISSAPWLCAVGLPA